MWKKEFEFWKRICRKVNGVILMSLPDLVSNAIPALDAGISAREILRSSRRMTEENKPDNDIKNTYGTFPASFCIAKTR